MRGNNKEDTMKILLMFTSLWLGWLTPAWATHKYE